MARENAILGNYEEALRRYRGAVQTVQNHMLIMHDVSSGVKAKWKQVLESIQREIVMTSDSLDLKKAFSGGFGGGSTFSTKKSTATERMPVNIISPDNNVVIQPIVPLP